MPADSYYRDAILDHYPIEVALDGNDYLLEARADSWLHQHQVDYMTYWEGDGDLWIYCFKDASRAVMFKLLFH